MILNVIKALKAGEELSNPATWKKGQHLTNTVGALVLSVMGLVRWKFPEANIPAELADTLTQIIVGVLIAVNLYLTPATTKKIGAKGNG